MTDKAKDEKKPASVVVGIVAVGADAVVGDVVVAMVALTQQDSKDFNVESDADNNLITVKSKSKDITLFKLVPNMAQGVYEIEKSEVDSVWPIARAMEDIATITYATGFTPKNSDDLTSKLSRAQKFCQEMIANSFGDNVIVKTAGFEALDRGWSAKKALEEAKGGEQFPHSFQQFDDRFMVMDTESMLVIPTAVVFAEAVATALHELHVQSLDIMYPDLQIGEFHGYAPKDADGGAWRAVGSDTKGFRGTLHDEWAKTLAKRDRRAATRHKGKKGGPDEELKYDKDKAVQMLGDLKMKLAERESLGTAGTFGPGLISSCAHRLNANTDLTDRQMFFLDRLHREWIKGERIRPTKKKEELAGKR